MKINNNISAVITNKHLLRNENVMASSMERLSSGFKINYAKDDPSGMAISNRMRAQIAGLDRASQNSSDGTSVLQTADGALNEIQSMLQRMRELSIQAANGTNSDSDRQAIQDEVSQLRDEIDRVSETTEFNTKKLLNGDLDTKVYAEGATREEASEEVEPGFYNFYVDEPSTRAAYGDFKVPSSADITKECSISINGQVAILKPGMSDVEILEKVRDAAEKGDAEIVMNDDNTVKGIWSKGYGNEGVLDFKVTDDATATLFGLDANPDVLEKADVKEDLDKDNDNNLNVEYKALYGNSAQIIMSTNENSAFKDHVTATYTVEGNRVTFTDRGGFKLQILLDEAKDVDFDTAYDYVKTDPLTAEKIRTKDDVTTKVPAEAQNTAHAQAAGIKYHDEKAKVDAPDPNDNTKTIKKNAPINGVGYMSVEVTDKGPMDLQIGANASQQMAVKLPDCGADMLYLDKVDVTTEDLATKSIDYIDYSMDRVNEIRSAVGAYSNRLESATASLDDTEENMTAAMSRIKDTDMAEEMTEYTKDNVIAQAATSALSQANDIPQMALQLLQ